LQPPNQMCSHKSSWVAIHSIKDMRQKNIGPTLPLHLVGLLTRYVVAHLVFKMHKSLPS
jgi:hypothetical protein